MKTLGKKTVFAACGGLLIMGSVYLSCRWAQTATPAFSDLTLANIEALASVSDDEYGDDFDDEYGDDLVVKIKCRGTGLVPCPTGGTAAEVVSKVRW